MTSCNPVCMSSIRYVIDIITGFCIYPRGFLFCLQKCYCKLHMENIGALVISLLSEHHLSGTAFFEFSLF